VLQRVAIAQALPDAIDDTYGDRDAVIALADKLSGEDVQLYYQIGLIGRRDLPLSPEPRGGFEMVMLRMLAFRPATASDTARPVVRAAAVQPAQPGKQSKAQRPAASKAARKTPAPDAAAGKAADPAGPSEWHALIESLSIKGMAREMALNCAFHGRTDDLVQLSLDPAHSHLLGKARLQQLEVALCDHYQQTVKVKISREAPLEDETPAAKQVREQNERQHKAELAIEQDDNIRAMQDAFGGTVNQDSLRPRT
jgi:DNA polymerase-3 subunit gamma/tau